MKDLNDLIWRYQKLYESGVQNLESLKSKNLKGSLRFEKQKTLIFAWKIILNDLKEFAEKMDYDSRSQTNQRRTDKATNT